MAADAGKTLESIVSDLSERVFVRAREWESTDDGTILILVPRFDGPFLRRFLLPKLRRPDFRIRLDVSGTAVWAMLDGTATVADVTEAMGRAFPDESNLPERVALFIRTLAIQGHVRETDPTVSDGCSPSVVE